MYGNPLGLLTFKSNRRCVMSTDMVRQSEEFGKDHGLIHEMIVTGRKVGAGQLFYSTLAHNAMFFPKVV